MKKRILAIAIAMLLTVSLIPSLFTEMFTANAASTTITVHYHRDDGEYTKWDVWAWSPDGAAYPFTGTDKFGVYAEITFDNPQDNKVGFIVRTESWEKDTGDDRFIDLNVGTEIWVFSGETEFYYEPPAGYEPEARDFENLTMDVNYFRYDGDYGNLSIAAIGNAGGTEYSWSSGLKKNTFGAGVNQKLGEISGVLNMSFAIKRGDEVIDYADGVLSLNKADENGKLSVWLMQGTGFVSYNPLNSKPAIQSATIEGQHLIRVAMNVPVALDKMSFAVDGVDGVTPDAPAGKITDASFGELVDGYARTFDLKTEGVLDYSQQYTLTCKGFDPVPVVLGNVFDSDEFAQLFTYTGNDLGATYTKDSTAFRVWAPTVAKAEVRLYDSGRVVPNVAEEYTAVEMTKDVNGTWVAKADGDLKGKYYTYAVLLGTEWHEAVDPYARAVGVNGHRGQIIDIGATDPAGWDSDKRPVTAKQTDAIIYELHVRDLSSQKESGITNKGKFLGIAETGTVSPAGEKTGLDHILDLGVTHIHLLPSYDYKTVNELFPEDNEFNWGYDPQNYNTPEGSYSTNAGEGSVRVSEFKQMVKTLHDNNLGVIMDVVYNHMYDGNTSNFQNLVPGYYFRFKEDGSYSNGSGCGNETASDREMMRKFMIDSVVYWASEFHVDGFRFDLMALHDIETMNQIRAALDKIDPTIMIYGEGWTGGGTTLAPELQSTKAQTYKLDSRIAAFSDDIRDGIKGSVFDDVDSGYINGNLGAVMEIRFGIAGSVEHPQVDMSRVSRSDNFWAKDPTQTVTYASAHDNMTLWDKLMATNPGASDADIEKQNKLSAAIVLTSQGIPFFQAGEEMARTKDGDHNSYKSPDKINKLDWVRKGEFKGLYEYYKGLIALRKATPAFRLGTGNEVRESLEFFDTGDETVIGYTLAENAGGGTTPMIAVVFNGTDGEVDVRLPYEGWDIMVNGDEAGLESLGTTGSTLSVGAKTAYVLFRNESVKDSVQEIVNPTPEPSPVPEAAPNPFPAWGWIALVAGILAIGGGAFVFLRKKR